MGAGAPFLAVVTAADIDALTAIVTSERNALSAAVIACLTTLDAATIDSWNQFVATVLAWQASRPGPSWTIVTPGPTMVEYYDDGRALEGVMRDNWYPRLAAAGCPVPAPPGPVPPLRQSTATPGSFLGDLSSGLWLLVGVLLLSQLGGRR